jgi:8-oxo-dGTP pyrophosphatase MutT (NUDIX family)
MAPLPLDPAVDRWQSPDDCLEAGVLLLLYPNKGDSTNTSGRISTSNLYLALIRRTEYPGVHSGQISFPGGRREGQESLQVTALRETQEEIGVRPHSLRVVGQLSPLYVPASNFCIYPFVAFSPVRPAFRLDSREVAELIETPLSHLLDPATCKEISRHFQNYGQRRIPYYDIFGHQVWGATAMMLSEFLALLAAARQEF